ncbi:hypothetical protein [Pedobacter sp. L105]|uniref:hypothetical protein n=1 Tax=Pedobacter sp. L105 TaxID=1641871 RepID=UPI00131CC1DD|nr:hypothetical protein [Pedobacter sp. L105]
MKKTSGLLALSAFILFVITSCSKMDGVTSNPSAAKPVVVDTVVKTPATTAAAGRSVAVGTGTGDLVIDGAVIGVKCNDVIQVKAGTYTSINISNINSGCPITVQNNGQVQIAGSNDQMVLKNVGNLTISGAGTAGITRGFLLRDNTAHRSIIISGVVHDLTVQNFSFKNGGDYTVYMDNSSIVYNASSTSTYSSNLKFLNIDCVNTQSFLQVPGGVNNGSVTGVLKGLEIAYLNFSASNCGDVVNVGLADDYNVHHNTINNINTTNNNHNGIFTMQGNGQFHHNLVTNHQGNALRAWARSLGTTPKQVLIYNNTVVNSRKYSAFECQGFADQMVAGKTTYADCKVYSNICGTLNTSKDWIGVIVDVYSLFGGTCQVYSNTGFNFDAPFINSYFVNPEASLVPVVTNNTYYASAAAAGINVNALAIQQ